MAKQMKRTSGHKPAGGPAGKNVKRVSVKTGPNAKSTTKINPCGVAQLGTHVGTARAVEKIPAGKAPQVELGNSAALRVGAGKPGADRTLYGQSGMQRQHGPSAGSPPREATPWYQDFPATKD